MPLAHLLVFTKGGAQFGDRIPIRTEFLPRVGELIQVGDEFNLAENTHRHAIVESVVYRLSGGRLIPFITARVGYDRVSVLQNRGWLTDGEDVQEERDEHDIAEQLDDPPEPGPPLDNEDFSLV